MARPSQGLIVVIHVVGEGMKIKVSCCWTCQVASLTEGMSVGPVSFVRQKLEPECGAAGRSEHLIPREAAAEQEYHVMYKASDR